MHHQWLGIGASSPSRREALQHRVAAEGSAILDGTSAGFEAVGTRSMYTKYLSLSTRSQKIPAHIFLSRAALDPSRLDRFRIHEDLIRQN